LCNPLKGQGLAFVVYPFAVTTIAGAPFWSICFFFMVVLLAIDTAIASVETTITSCYDAFPFLTKTTLRKHIVKIAMCVFYFLGGLLYCIQSGTYWLELVNNYAGGIF
jgi:SNF family Na+-dependent transporter